MDADLLELVNYIADKTWELKNKYVEEEIEADYLCIFAQSESEFERLNLKAQEIGEVGMDTSTGLVYKINEPIKAKVGEIKLLKIRQVDPSKKQRGDSDFVTDYESFKEKYLKNEENFSLIEREDFEMIELKDPEFDVLVYFSNPPLSKQLGV